MADLACPVCPVCGGLPEYVFGLKQAMCGSESCAVLFWNPSAEDGGASAVQLIYVEDYRDG